MSDSNEKSNVKSSDPPTGAEANSGMAVNHNNNDNDNSSSSSNNNNNNGSSSSIRLVVQRYRKASLLLEEKQVVTVGFDGGSSSSSSSLSLTTGHSELGEKSQSHIGMLVYVSFSKTAQAQDLQKAARTILNLPIHTEGGWGDGSATKSIVQVAVEAATTKARTTKLSNDNEAKTTSTTKEASSTVSILLVPQANIIAKVKKNGKSIQYRDQIDKATGETLYHGFCQMVEALLLEEQQNRNATKEGTRAASNNNNSKGNGPAVPASVLPKDYFRCLQEQQQQEQLYGSFDPSTGLPLTTADGQPLTKSARKRVQKLWNAHRNRHQKYLASVKPQDQQQEQEQEQSQEQSQDTQSVPPQAASASSSPHLDPSFVQLVTGSFGKRQGLELVSDMGPFCHVIDI